MKLGNGSLDEEKERLLAVIPKCRECGTPIGNFHGHRMFCDKCLEKLLLRQKLQHRIKTKGKLQKILQLKKEGDEEPEEPEPKKLKYFSLNSVYDALGMYNIFINEQLKTIEFYPKEKQTLESFTSISNQDLKRLISKQKINLSGRQILIKDFNNFMFKWKVYDENRAAKFMDDELRVYEEDRRVKKMIGIFGKYTKQRKSLICLLAEDGAGVSRVRNKGAIQRGVLIHSHAYVTKSALQEYAQRLIYRARNPDREDI